MSKFFARKLRQLRESLGLTQKEMAQKFDISAVGYGGWERNTAEPSITNLIKISQFFDVSIDNLIGLTKKVFVSGCYDMLHSGHVAFFEEASKLGDLYVGLGSDATIAALKNRKTVNGDAERLYMVKSIRYVKDAWINSGSGIMDFEKEVLALKPDIFFVNSDGFSQAKADFCKAHGIELVVSERIPSPGLPARSTTALRNAGFGEK